MKEAKRKVAQDAITLEDVLYVLDEMAREDLKIAVFEPIEICRTTVRVTTEDLEFVQMDGETSTEEVLTTMEQRGLRPVLHHELLGCDRSALKKGDIAALGDVCSLGGARGGGPHVLRLKWQEGMWRTRFAWTGCAWPPDMLFAGARKQPKP